ncbi:Izh3 protein [Saccharomycopsis crataegensis]|uniref:Izh3 protein n=1 Tax=Saccharomycopsis crataegensis TaxID=43959 RepID=A0AAV5QI26_9ASCO|nr:Izh3 protein [Saccharomycopsis crataegensis]
MMMMSSGVVSTRLPETDGSLLRKRKSTQKQDDIVEENLLNNIDSFLEQLEHKLDNFEQYFLKNRNVDPTKVKNGVTNAASSFEEDLENFYGSLKLMKSSLLESTASKLETINSFFIDNYSALFSNPIHPTSSTDIPPTISDSENTINYQIISGLEYLEAKLNKIDQLIGNFQPKFNMDYLNYYNYDEAVSTGYDGHLHYYQLPFLWRENRFIIHGYRFYPERHRLLKSIFSVPFHNESANIWSHLSGALFLTYLAFYHYPTTEAYLRNEFNHWLDHGCVYLFFFASLNCLVCSTLWHTFAGTSVLNFRNRCVCLDYTGITVLISASIITTQYSTLYYFPKLKLTCVTATCVLAGLGFFLNWSPRFDRPESRPLRVCFFVSLAGSGAVCFLILCFYKGFSHSLQYFSPLFPSFASYLTGVVFYSLLIPERWRSDVILDEKLPDTNCLYETIHADLMASKKNKTFQDCACDSDLINRKFLERHFLAEPEKTKNHGNFTSLWWVDYVFSSHSIWHFFVLGGILGHYYGILQMFANIEVNKPIVN